MSCFSCVLTTFENELKNDPIVKKLTQSVVERVETLITERLDAHTSNIIILLNNAKN